MEREQRSFERLEQRDLLCGVEAAAVVSSETVQREPGAVGAAAAVFDSDTPVEVAPNTFVVSHGGGRHVVYAKLDGSGLTDPGASTRITGTVEVHADGSLDTSQVIPRSAGQRRLELSVLTTGVTVRRTPPGWKPDPTLPVAPTVQAAAVLGPSGYEYESWGLQQAQATWERLGPDHWERVYGNWYSSEELVGLFDGSMRSRVVYG